MPAFGRSGRKLLTAGAVIINMVFFGESRKMSRIVGVGLIVIGVVGLKMVS